MDASNVIPSKGQSYKFLKSFLCVALCIFIIGIIYFYIVGRKANKKKIKVLISDEAKKYESPLEVEKLLYQGVLEIESSPIRFKQATSYAKATGVPLEQVLVDSAVTMAKNIGYIN